MSELKPFSLPSRQPKEGDASRQPKLLYVEDEDDNWVIAAKRLNGKYLLQRARNAAEAFAKLRAEKFAAILMDIQLTNSSLNGIEIARVLRGLNRDTASMPEFQTPMVDKETPIIFVTAYSARYTREELVGQGGNEMITKPVDFIQLTSAITRLILHRLK